MASQTQNDLNYDRNRIYSSGDDLLQQEKQRREAAVSNKNQYQGWGSDVYTPLTEGRGGYSQTEQDAINGGDMTSLLPTDADYQSNFLTPEEQAGVAGDPSSRGKYFDPSGAQSQQDASATAQRGAAAGLRSGVYSSIDEPDLRLSDDYAPGVDSTLSSSEDRVRGAADPDRLREDPGYAARVRMTPDQQQDIVTSAGIDAGTGYRAAAGDITRQAQAAGVDPLGAAAMKERLLRQGAGESADALTKARIGASDAAAQREQDIEQQRRAGETTAAQIGSSNELALSGQRLTAQERTEQMRQAAAQDIANRKMQAATTSGQADIANEQAINTQGRQVGQFNTTTGTALATGQEQDAASRAAAIAKARTDTAQANQANQFSRGAAVNTEQSQRAKSIADERLKEAAEGRAYVTHQGDVATASEGQAASQQGQLYGTEGGLAQQNTQAQAAEDSKPKWYDKVISAGIGAAGAISGTGGLASLVKKPAA